MTDNPSESPDSEDLAKKSLNRLRKAEIAHERVKTRMKFFHLFGDTEYEDYKGEKRHVPKAQIKARDPASLQMMLARRDRYEACVRQIARLERLIDAYGDAGSGKEAADLIKQIVALEAIADRHAKGIEAALADLNKKDTAVQAQRAKLLTSAAAMAQHDRHHADKMELQRRQNPGDMPDAELLRIANAEEEGDSKLADG